MKLFPRGQAFTPPAALKKRLRLNAKPLGGSITGSALGRYEIVLFILLTVQFAAFVILLTRMNAVSILSLFAGLAVAAAYGYIGYQIFFLDSRKLLTAFRKVSEFLPVFAFAFYLFVSAFALKNDDSLTAPVILFFTILITSVVLVILFSRSMNAIQDEAAKGKKSILFTSYEWLEAFVFAAFWVLLVHVFLFQLYEIPSESMVPTFLEHERVMVAKLPNGPKFPLSNVGLPPFKKLERGDIAVLRNPRYERTRANEVKSTFSQMLYMLTLTSVNIDKYDDQGRLKADPLVKRIIGMPGEKLMMVNDVVYVKASRRQRLQRAESR